MVTPSPRFCGGSQASLFPRSAGRKPGGSPEGLPHITVRTLLEVELQRQLQIARRLIWLPDPVRTPKVWLCNCSAAGAEAHPVEDVERLGAEFQPDLLSRIGKLRVSDMFSFRFGNSRNFGL